MAHYAFLNENNVVTEIIVGIHETELIEGLDTETWYANFKGQPCKRTSYNGNIRYNYAGVGFTYDPIDDAFIPPLPQCGHVDYSLNNLKRWECSDCEAALEQISNPTA